MNRWAVACIGAFLATGVAQADADVGKTAPTLVLKTLDGSVFDLTTHRGRVVLINYWATWCTPCRREMPSLDAVFRRHRTEGLDVVGISADRPRHRDEVVQVMRAFAYPAGLVSEASPNGFGGVDALPLTYVIDRRGVVAARLDHPATEDELERLVRSLLAPIAPAPSP